MPLNERLTELRVLNVDGISGRPLNLNTGHIEPPVGGADDVVMVVLGGATTHGVAGASLGQWRTTPMAYA